MGELIPLEDMLFVFEAWTLMLRQEVCQGLELGMNIDLFNQHMEKIGSARLYKYLNSRNPKILAIEVDMVSIEQDMKEVKFIKAVL